MTHSLKFISIILLVLFIFSCKNSEETAQDLYSIKIDINKSKPEPKYSDFIENYDFVPLQTKKESLIGNVDKVITTKNDIYMLDIFSTKSVFKFSRKGEFVSKIGFLGDGPGGYTLPLDFEIDLNQEKIFVLDNGVRLCVYDLDGSFIENKPLSSFTANRVAVLDKGDLAWLQGGIEDKLLVTNNELKNIQSFFSYRSQEIEIIPSQTFQKTKNNQIVFRQNFNDTVYVMDNKRPVPKLYLDFQNAKFTNKNLEEAISKKSPFQSLVAEFSGSNGFFEVNNAYLISAFVRGKPYLVAHSKKTNNTLIAALQQIENDITIEKQTSYPIGIDHYTDSVIFLVSTQSLFRAIDNYKGENTTYFNRLKELSKTMDKDDNPILLFAKIKDEF